MVSSIDLYPTLAGIAGAEVPTDRIIDGKNISSLMFDEDGATSPRDEFFYYKQNSLEAVRSGNWKLHVRKADEEVNELYDLSQDVGETNNLFDKEPEVVARLMSRLDACRQDMGDEATGVVGQNVRPVGRVENAKLLTEYDPDHPYIIAMYDKPHRG